MAAARVGARMTISDSRGCVERKAAARWRSLELEREQMRARGATDNYRRLEEEQIAVRKEVRELAAAQRETSRQLDNFRSALVMATPSGASISPELSRPAVA